MNIVHRITITVAAVGLTVGAAASPSLAKKAPAAPVPTYQHIVTHKQPPSPVVPKSPGASKLPPTPPPVTPSGERAQVAS